MLKKCTKCGDEFPATLEYFPKHRATKSGLNSWCIKCMKIKQQEWKDNNKKYTADYNKQYWNKHKDENKDDRKEYIKEYYLNNKDQLLEYQKEYYIQNKEHISERGKEYNKEWRKNGGQEYHNMKTNEYRTAKRQLETTLTREEWESLKEIFNYSCAYCRESNTTLEQDHIIPLTKGGNYTMENILPACRSCNASKGNRNLGDWLLTREGVKLC